MRAAALPSAAVCLLASWMGMPMAAAEQSDAPAIGASISRPVSSTGDLPSITFTAAEVQRSGRPVPYTARLSASVDGSGFTPVGEVQPGKGQGGRVDVVLPTPAARPGFHSVRLRADFSEESAIPSITLPAMFYAIYDPLSESTAAVRALVYGPGSTPVRDLDPQLGDEPFAAWLSGIVSARRTGRDTAPEWWSDYCHSRTADPTHQPPATAICSVVAFGTRGEVTEIWCRTADIRETERGVEWVPVAPAQFEGMTLNRVPETRGLSALSALLDISPELRAAGDISILPDDIVSTPDAPKPGVPADVKVTVRNIGHQDLHKVSVSVAWGVDVSSRPASRQFVVDVPAQATAEITLQVAFPNGYGFVMAHAMSVGEHSPSGTWTPDPTPEDDCALRVIAAPLAPATFKDKLLEAAGGGCAAK